MGKWNGGGGMKKGMGGDVEGYTRHGIDSSGVKTLEKIYKSEMVLNET